MRRRRRLILLLVLMVVLPLGALAVVGVRLVRDGGDLVARQAGDVAAARLDRVVTALQGRLDERTDGLVAALGTLPPGADAAAIRAWRRARPELGQVLVVGRDGSVVFPPEDGPRSAAEREFLERTRGIRENRVLPQLAAGAGAPEGEAVNWGWYGWYHDGGLRLLLWRVDGDRIVAVERSRARLLADVVAALPDTTTSPDGADTSETVVHRTALLDTRGRTVYAWGRWQPPEGTPPRATAPLAPPLGAWHVARWAPPDRAAESVTRSLGLGVGAGLAALALALGGIAVWLYRERTREMRLAAQRVSFVGQVSHELRTPLTNIRLYAELLADGLQPDEDELDRERARQLDVVIDETRRLERLIGNVLSFARSQEDRLALRPRVVAVDTAVRRALDSMGPTLAAAGVAVETDLAAGAPAQVDPDVVEQVLANLLGNVAKYAARGGRVAVTSRQRDGRATVRVTDDGPGVPPAHRERIFEPFHRVSDRVSDGVAGTGIGLDIARRLARLHGGDLRLVPSERGASFELEIAAPPAADGEESDA